MSFTNWIHHSFSKLILYSSVFENRENEIISEAETGNRLPGKSFVSEGFEKTMDAGRREGHGSLHQRCNTIHSGRSTTTGLKVYLSHLSKVNM